MGAEKGLTQPEGQLGAETPSSLRAGAGAISPASLPRAPLPQAHFQWPPNQEGRVLVTQLPQCGKGLPLTAPNPVPTSRKGLGVQLGRATGLQSSPSSTQGQAGRFGAGEAPISPEDSS